MVGNKGVGKRSSGKPKPKKGKKGAVKRSVRRKIRVKRLVSIKRVSSKKRTQKRKVIRGRKTQARIGKLKVKKTQEETISLHSFLLLFAAVFCMTIFVTILVYSTKVILKIENIPAEVTVERNKIGFDINNSYYRFGVVAPGACSKRESRINNTYDFPVELRFMGKGEIGDWIRFTEPVIVLKPGESKLTYESACPPMETEEGFYEGYVRIEFRRAKPLGKEYSITV